MMLVLIAQFFFLKMAFAILMMLNSFRNWQCILQSVRHYNTLL